MQQKEKIEEPEIEDTPHEPCQDVGARAQGLSTPQSILRLSTTPSPQLNPPDTTSPVGYFLADMDNGGPVNNGGPHLGAPQPDMAQVQQAFGQLAVELPKFSNLQPVANNNAILNALQQMQNTQQQMQNTQQQMQNTQQQMQNTQQQMQNTLQQIQNTQQQMLQDVRQIREQVNELDATMNDVQERVDETLGELRDFRTETYTRQLAMEFNSASRVYNAGVRSSESTLAALKSLSTNDFIDGYPDTGAELSNMGAAELDGVLDALFVPIPEELEEKKRALRFHIGLSDTA